MNAHLPPSSNETGEENGREGGRGGFRIHPLFLLVGVFYACTGELFVFFVSTLVALQHECAHAFAAAKLGYRLNRVVLMPYGAVIDGDIEGISFKDEISVAAWGPLCNLLTALGFVALWWLFPATYPFTDIACQASLWTAAVNLLPAYPLDGGRVLHCLLAKRLGEKRAEKLCKRLSFVFAAGLSLLFLLFLVRSHFQLGLLLFAVLLFVGALGNADKAGYQKIDFSAKKAMARGVEIKKVAVLQSCTIRRALSFEERGKFLILEIYNEREEKIAEIDQNELAEMFGKSENGAKIADFL